eukprot:GHVP01046934.1.p1 GENE.GHVP01046934.1~~GHVP01046934.1.p1  ORF type:complete len:102 (+),score=15.68 GHVP01046934.1:28-306(+)
MGIFGEGVFFASVVDYLIQDDHQVSLIQILNISELKFYRKDSQVQFDKKPTVGHNWVLSTILLIGLAGFAYSTIRTRSEMPVSHKKIAKQGN